VLSVSAEPLSPERGSYGFSQQMLRQVAYDTLSRRDRKVRHLAVAAHLRAAYPGDGEEVADAIARHYLDALAAIPDDPDADQIRERAIGALIRAAERAERTGAPALAAASYAAAAGLIPQIPPDGTDGLDVAAGGPAAGGLWERAARAADASADWATAVEHAGRAQDYYLEHGQARAAARAQSIAGQAMRQWGHHGQARDQLTAAVEVLRADPDSDTVHALEELANVEVMAGSASADRLSVEALILGQDLGVAAGQLGDLFVTRGIYLTFAGRHPEAIAYFREGVQLATQAGDNLRLGRVLLNLSNALAGTDPGAAVRACRAAAGHLRGAGHRDLLVYATLNTVQALLMLGDWDTAEEDLTQAADADRLGDHEFLSCHAGWLAALRGDIPTAETILAALQDLRASEDPQDQAFVSTVEAFTAAARGRPKDALGHARAVLGHVGTLGIGHDGLRWAWPLAARCAHELDDTNATGELLALLDAHKPGRLAPMERAERDLVRARLAGQGAAFADAVAGLRELSTPYHLAHGLLDHAEFLARLDDAETAALAITEAREIGERLRCQPLLDRADAIEHANPGYRPDSMTPPDPEESGLVSPAGAGNETRRGTAPGALS
jgi:tetratricopeptide (TPR) repeat protein